jgi:hypothetical protein
MAKPEDDKAGYGEEAARLALLPVQTQLIELVAPTIKSSPDRTRR